MTQDKIDQKDALYQEDLQAFREQEHRDLLAKEQRHYNDLRALMRHPEFLRVVAQWLELTGHNAVSEQLDPQVLAHKEGARMVGMGIWLDLVEASPEQVVRMELDRMRPFLAQAKKDRKGVAR